VGPHAQRFTLPRPPPLTNVRTLAPLLKHTHARKPPTPPPPHSPIHGRHDVSGIGEPDASPAAPRAAVAAVEDGVVAAHEQVP
jgi:hypothetical protein